MLIQIAQSFINVLTSKPTSHLVPMDCFSIRNSCFATGPPMLTVMKMTPSNRRLQRHQQLNHQQLSRQVLNQ